MYPHDVPRRSATPCWHVAMTVLILWPLSVRGDGPVDNQTAVVRPVPPVGIPLSDADQRRLDVGLRTLAEKIAGLRDRRDEWIEAYLPDVEIFYRAVHDPWKYQEFYAEEEVNQALRLLQIGYERARQLLDGETPWVVQTGLVARGYRSRLDGSVQPYGLVVPENYSTQTNAKYRLDIWFHGRGEKLTELNFILPFAPKTSDIETDGRDPGKPNRERPKVPGIFAPADTFVLHPYGRYCNAFKFAGEVDVQEAWESVQRQYRIDQDRTSVRGFSMGGAACWQFAVHFPDQWFAANPGAGFAETPEFLKSFQKETLQPTWYEQKLWNWYDCNRWAENLRHCRTVAYSGEIDVQRQAAEVMAKACESHGFSLVHLIGPQTAHSYHPDSAREVERRLDALAMTGRERTPHQVTLTTYTLKYHRLHWVNIDGLNEHWSEARVHAYIDESKQSIHVETRNVSDLTLDFGPGELPPALRGPVKLVINGQVVQEVPVNSDRSWRVQAHQTSDHWSFGGRPADGLRKVHDLQGPIDDGFMDSFLFVQPTGSSPHPQVQAWVASELQRAIAAWRSQFRGHVRIKTDVELTADEISRHHLILWGDPRSNRFLGDIADELPIRWNRDRIQVGDVSFPADQHGLVAIYPNPRNPQRYVVLNSGFTFREFAYLNNARQVAKLPDWAVVDLRTPADSLWPGKIVSADFFDERWGLKVPHRD